MVNLSGSSGGGAEYDYVADSDPTATNNVEVGSQWYDTSTDTAKIYDGEDWSLLTNNPLPSGIITMWSGASSNVPVGWTLCDGSDGTPDLTNRFVVGAGDQYAEGETGGAEQVQLTEAEMPSHSHGTRIYDGSGGTDGHFVHTYGIDLTSEIQTTPAGSDQAHENRPPFYALAFIMKE